MFGSRYRRDSGAIVINGSHVASTQQCVHCGNHERVVRGSGTKRGWCTLCNGFLCGKKQCMDNCTPFEAQVEYQEAINANRLDLVKKLTSRYPSLKELRF